MKRTCASFAALLTLALGACATPATTAGNPDLNSCGVYWHHDEGNISVWQARRRAVIAIGEFNSNGQYNETTIPMNPGDFVSIKMHVQRARCL